MISKTSENISNNGDTIINKQKHDFPNEEIFEAKFETAVSEAKFGKFNILLFCLAIPGGWTAMIENTTMSYVFPAAQCDLALSLSDKGFLNAIVFVGMISSGCIWGFLCDMWGRKKLIVFCFLVDACFVVISGFSQTFLFLLIFKFLGGSVINGAFTGISVYLPEFHRSDLRSRVQLIRGMIISFGTMVLPLIALSILPQQIHLSLFNNNFVLHSWNVFLFVCSIPSLVAGIIFIFMPESPKFLMTTGRNEEALQIFQTVYSFNTGRDRADFPVKSLADEKEKETETDKISKIQALKNGIRQVKPLFFRPHAKYVILMCSMHAVYISSFNTLRLWLPQIFQAMSDHEYFSNGTNSDLCAALETLTMAEQANATCQFNPSTSVYVNTMITACSQILGYVAAAVLVNKLGKKLLLGLSSVSAGVCALSIYFSQSSVTVVALSSMFLGIGGVCGIVLITIVIDSFPTSLRAITTSIVMTSAQTASMIGNLIFPSLLSLGCAPPFLSVGISMIVCSLLVILLPNTENKALQ